MHHKLVPHHHLFIGKLLEILPMHSRNSFRNKIFWNRIIKNLTSIMFLNPVSVYRNYWPKNWNYWPRTCCWSLFSFAKFVNKFSFFSDSSNDHLWSFNWMRFLNHSYNLCKHFHDIIIILLYLCNSCSTASTVVLGQTHLQ